ncbi:MAG: aquaporin Z [Bifidobacteriaceae bacterium]|jgi:aquaporin Z|nr:aquaporin Z [Bifidobacteriaceae bacterium]
MKHTSPTTAGPTTGAKFGAEALGTFVLVLGGCGTAIFAGDYVGYLGVALAFGLTVVVGAYAFGPISGGHFNPAVTCGLAAAGRFEWHDAGTYIAAQVLGGLAATSLIAGIAAARSEDGFSMVVDSGFAANGYGDHSPTGASMTAAILVEFFLTAVFLFVIIGATAKAAAPGFAGLAIGLTLTLVHLISIPIDNTSVNPARSLAAAVYGGGWALGQLWLFILFPIAGGVVAGLISKPLFKQA